MSCPLFGQEKGLMNFKLTFVEYSKTTVGDSPSNPSHQGLPGVIDTNRQRDGKNPRLAQASMLAQPSTYNRQSDDNPHQVHLEFCLKELHFCLEKITEYYPL